MNTTVAYRYSQAFFDYTQEHHAIDRVNNDMHLLGKFLKGSMEFNSLVTQPTIESSKRVEILRTSIKNHLDPLTFIFLLFLENKKRLNFLSLVINAWNKIYLEEKNTLHVKVVSASPIDEKYQKKIISRLNEKLKKEIKLDLSVQPNLLGGLKLQIGDTVFDSSFSYQLEQFKKNYLLN